jgi:hypothetical protein
MTSPQYGNGIADAVVNGTSKEPTILLDIHQVLLRPSTTLYNTLDGNIDEWEQPLT